MRILYNDITKQEGGKAFTLYKLKKHFNVPDFFVVKINNILELNNKEKEIAESCKILNTQFYAVRSSASLEDSEHASFAGIFNSYINLKINEVVDSVKKVFNSCFSNRVYSYCKLRDISPEDVKMNIIVQKQIDSKLSGVCFYNDKETIIEWVDGQCENLVSGNVAPKFIKIKTGEKMSQIDCNHIFNEICDLAEKIKGILGFNAVDMEWAYDDKVYIIQARPLRL